MLDDFRQQASASSFDDEEETMDFAQTAASSRPPLLGMTPKQRFVIALLLFILTCLLSSFCLLVMEKVAMPFLS